jgi:DNA-binding MarR family transcriptional regulator
MRAGNARRVAAVTRPERQAERLERFLTYRLHQVGKLTDRHSSDAYAAEVGLPPGEARCLAAVGNFAPLSVVELASRANLHKGPASRAAQALVERGLLAKEASATDGRGVVLTLTPAGRKLWSGVMDLIARRNQEIFGCLSRTEQQQLGSMLDRLIEHAQGRQYP